MTHDQFEREKNYRVALSIAKAMLLKKLITQPEFNKINAMLIKQYKPVFGGL